MGSTQQKWPVEEVLGRELREGPGGIGAPVREASTPSERIGLLGLQGSDSAGDLKKKTEICFLSSGGQKADIRLSVGWFML